MIWLWRSTLFVGGRRNSGCIAAQPLEALESFLFERSSRALDRLVRLHVLM
jgi:hypothetical protein